MQTGRKEVGLSVIPLVTNESSRGITGIQIYAAGVNTDTVYVGFRDTISADVDDDTDGYAIEPGKAVLLPIKNPNLIYLIAGAASQKIWWIIV